MYCTGYRRTTEQATVDLIRSLDDIIIFISDSLAVAMALTELFTSQISVCTKRAISNMTYYVFNRTLNSIISINVTVKHSQTDRERHSERDKHTQRDTQRARDTVRETDRHTHRETQ